jgi:hypothetical protein
MNATSQVVDQGIGTKPTRDGYVAGGCNYMFMLERRLTATGSILSLVRNTGIRCAQIRGTNPGLNNTVIALRPVGWR